MGYSSWGNKESDMTERLTLNYVICIRVCMCVCVCVCMCVCVYSLDQLCTNNNSIENLTHNKFSYRVLW